MSLVPSIETVPSSGNNLFFQGIVSPARIRRAVFPSPRSVPLEGPEARECGDFLDRLFQMAGLTACSYRGPALLRRMKACLRALGAPDPSAALRRLDRHPELLPAALNAVLLGVTEFFRDSPVFEFLERHVLPDLAEKSKAAPPRVWSAACSDGRELCSVAMLLEEAGILENGDLLGTDCRAQAVRQAEAGVFPAAALQDLSEERRRRHFVPGEAGGTLRLSSGLRNALRWRIADLLKETAPGPWDMILWRNMAIYLKPEVAESVWTALCRELSPGGWLITGKAEQPPRHLPLARVTPCVYRKTD